MEARLFRRTPAICPIKTGLIDQHFINTQNMNSGRGTCEIAPTLMQRMANNTQLSSIARHT